MGNDKLYASVFVCVLYVMYVRIWFSLKFFTVTINACTHDIQDSGL